MEGGRYQPPQKKEAAFTTGPPGGTGSGDRRRLTLESGERQFTHPLKPIAQRCLADMRFYEKDDYTRFDRRELYGGIGELIAAHIKAFRSDLQKETFPKGRRTLAHDLVRRFDHPRTMVAYMIITDHNFFQGTNEQERWTERDKRYLLDVALAKDIAECQEQDAIGWDEHERMRAYHPQDDEELEGWEREDIEMYKKSIRLDRQLQNQLRQQGQPPSSRKVIPIR